MFCEMTQSIPVFKINNTNKKSVENRGRMFFDMMLFMW